MRTAAELTVGRDHEAVPKARRFVRSLLVCEPDGTVHDVETVATELVTNGLLHGEPPVTVRLILNQSRIRVEVEDTGFSLPVVSRYDPQSMTGRGLALVAALSSAWGVDAGRSRGKVVWAELSADGPSSGSPRAPAMDPAAVAAAKDARLAGPSLTVHLGPVPTRLLLDAKAHIDNVVRELTLVQGGERSGGATVPAAMTDLVKTVTEDFAVARSEMKRLALAAAARGAAVTEVTLNLPISYAAAGERYLAALDDADRYARSARLLTMAPPLSHRAFRRWYVGSIVEQLRALAEGQRPPPAEPLALVLAIQLDELEARTLRPLPD